MKRRDFITTTAIGAAAVGGSVGLAGCGEGPGARRRGVGGGNNRQVRWRLASSFPRSLDILFGAADQLSDRVSQLTGGAFQIKTYQGGEIVPPLEVFDAVSQGSVEIGHSAGYYFIGKNPSFAFDCTVPFGLNARQQNAWMYYGGGLELLRPLFAEFNVINIPGGNTGVQMGGWFRNPIDDLADLKGRKMRIPGLGGKVMEQLGVTSQVIPGGEIYISLERGAIDAAEWVGPYDDLKLGLHEVAKNYYYPGWWEPGAMLSYYINRDAWQSLPEEYRGALEAACAESNVMMMAGYDAKNSQALRTILGSGVTLRPFPEDVMRQAYQASRDIMNSQGAADPTYRTILESMRAWQKDSGEWFGTSEQGYATFMLQQLMEKDA